MQHILKEPFLHFIFIGILVFGAHYLLNPQGTSNDSSNTTLHITTEVKALVKSRVDKQQLQTGRFLPPSSDEYHENLKNEMDSYIREEIFYREGIARELDKGDNIVKNRITQKMMLLAVEQASATAPSEDKLLQYYNNHLKYFTKPKLVDIWQVFFDKEKRGNTLEADCQAAWNKVKKDSNTPAAELASLGDYSRDFRRDMRYLELQQLNNYFGKDSAKLIFSHDQPGWIEPIKSADGCHLVKILNIHTSKTLSFNEARPDVVKRFEEERNKQALDAFYQSLREKYQVVTH